MRIHLQRRIEERQSPQGGEVGTDAVGVVHRGTQLGTLRGEDNLEHAVDAVRVLVLRICAYERRDEWLRRCREIMIVDVCDDV